MREKWEKEQKRGDRGSTEEKRNIYILIHYEKPLEKNMRERERKTKKQIKVEWGKIERK